MMTPNTVFWRERWKFDLIIIHWWIIVGTCSCYFCVRIHCWFSTSVRWVSSISFSFLDKIISILFFFLFLFIFLKKKFFFCCNVTVSYFYFFEFELLVCNWWPFILRKQWNLLRKLALFHFKYYYLYYMRSHFIQMVIEKDSKHIFRLPSIENPKGSSNCVIAAISVLFNILFDVFKGTFLFFLGDSCNYAIVRLLV